MTGVTVPTRMRAVVQDRFGPATELHLREVPLPVPDETSVLLKVHAASINALDWRYMSGRPRIARLFAFGLTRPKKAIRGVDVAGEVVAGHTGTPRFHAGDRVFGLASGSFAEYAAADESELVLVPPTVAYSAAATLGVAAFTALQAVRDIGETKRGQSTLILSAASGVGTFAVQLAKWIGASVTAVTSTPNVELVKRIGADEVVDYTKVDVRRLAKTYDRIIDIGGLYSLGSCRRMLNEAGIMVVVGIRGGIGRILMVPIVSRLGRGNGKIVTFTAHCRVSDLELLGQLVTEGKLNPIIAHEYSLEQVPLAMADASAHNARGKLVINVP